jgi:ketosteroid isomerase-like protein
MSTQTKEMIRDLYSALSGGNVEALLNAMTDDVNWYSPGGAPYDGHHMGRDAVRRYFSEFERAVRLDQFDVDDVLEDGDRVVVLGRERATVKETGRDFSTRFAHVYRLRKGKIVDVVIFDDTHAAASAFGESARERQAMGGPMGVTHEAYSGRTRD